MSVDEDKVTAMDEQHVEKVATRLAMYCLPGTQTPDYKKDRIYWEALQLAWLTPSSMHGQSMLKELKALERRGEIEAEIEAAVTIIRKYHQRNFQQ